MRKGAAEKIDHRLGTIFAQTLRQHTCSGPTKSHHPLHHYIRLPLPPMAIVCSLDRLVNDERSKAAQNRK